MKRLRLSLGLIVSGFLLASCGGGGGKNPSSTADAITVPIVPGQPTTARLSGVTITVSDHLFTQAGELKVTKLDLSLSPKPASPQVKLDQLFRIESTATAGTGTITLSFPNQPLSDHRWQVVTSTDGQTWRAYGVMHDSTGATSTIPVDAIKSPTREPLIGGKLYAAIAKIPYAVDFSETRVELYRLAGSGPINRFPTSGKVGMLIHGVNSSALKLQPAAEFLVNNHQFDVVYGLCYPWANGVKANFRALADLLKAQPPEVKATIIAHSFGGLQIRYVLEQDDNQNGDRASFHVAQLITLGSPFAGSPFADKTTPYEWRNQALNDPRDDGPTWRDSLMLGDMVTVASNEMIPGSDLLKTLDTPKNHLNRVPYLTIAGTQDQLAPSDSAHHLPDNATTGGRFDRISLKRDWEAGHLNLLTSQDCLKWLVDVLIATQLTSGPTLAITASNNAKASDDGWEVTFLFEDKLAVNTTLTIDEIVMRTSSKDGAEYSRQWYSTGVVNGFYPNQRRFCELLVAKASTAVIHSHCWFDQDKHAYAQADPKTHALTVEVYAHGHDSLNRPFTSTVTIKLLDKDGSGPTIPRATIQPHLAPGAFLGHSTLSH